jgi:hypothetical protein
MESLCPTVIITVSSLKTGIKKKIKNFSAFTKGSYDLRITRLKKRTEKDEVTNYGTNILLSYSLFVIK